MKKILFLLLICLIKLNAYEYEIYFNKNTTATRKQYFTDINGKLQVKQLNYETNNIIYNNITPNVFSYLNNIRNSSLSIEEMDNKISGSYYIGKEFFIYFLRNDIKLLNDFYLTNENSLQSILNFYYNNDGFSTSNHIKYENYQILYNSDGLAVESIVCGEWAGLYDDNEKQFSGKLYDKDGFLLYNNGEKVDYIGKWLNQLIKPFDTTVMGVINILSFAALSAIICYYVMDALWYVIDLALWALTGGRRHLNYEYYH